MEITEAIMNRHSVRRYMNIAIKDRIADEIRAKIDDINSETGLGIQLVQNDPEGFKGILAHYGNFSGVNNYIVMAGPEGMDKEIGYYGEELVILAQQLGLNTCWAGISAASLVGAFDLDDGEAYCISIAVGYGEDHGNERSTKVFDDVVTVNGPLPAWFRSGVDAALLAPTAMNRQSFRFELLDDGHVRVSVRRGVFSRVDLGIIKYHFEEGSGKDGSVWA